MSAPAVPIPLEQPDPPEGGSSPDPHLHSAPTTIPTTQDFPIVEAELIESLRESERLRDLLREEMRQEIRAEILAEYDFIQERLPAAYATAAPDPPRGFGQRNNANNARVEAAPERRRGVWLSLSSCNWDAAKKRSLLIRFAILVSVIVIVSVTVSTLVQSNNNNNNNKEDDSLQWKRHSELVGTTEKDQWGFAVSISGDGITAAASARTSFDNLGSVKVFRKTNDGAWLQHGAILLGSEVGGTFGASLDLSHDGSVLVVGSFHDDSTSNTGYVSVYRAPRTDSSHWIQVGQTLYGNQFGDRFGAAVSVAGDGTTIAVGAPGQVDSATERGHVRVYRLNVNDEWIDISRNDFQGRLGDAYGWDVSLSFDGHALAISAGYESGVGKVWIFDRHDNDWVERLTFVGESHGELLGRSVHLSETGDILVIGVPGHGPLGKQSAGLVSVYRIDGKEPKQIGSDVVGTSSVDLFGWSVALSSDNPLVGISNNNPYEGMTLVASAIHHRQTTRRDKRQRSYVRMFQYDSKDWKQVGEVGGEMKSWFGQSVDVGGEVVLIGAPRHTENGQDRAGMLQFFTSSS